MKLTDNNMMAVEENKKNLKYNTEKEEFDMHN